MCVRAERGLLFSSITLFLCRNKCEREIYVNKNINIVSICFVFGYHILGRNFHLEELNLPLIISSTKKSSHCSPRGKYGSFSISPHLRDYVDLMRFSDCSILDQFIFKRWVLKNSKPKTAQAY